MPVKTAYFAGLSGNQLKLIALICMTADHVGLQLFPGVVLLRVIGRLALPVYAYMIAEGCRYTRNRLKYLGQLAILGLVCQIVYFIAMGSLAMCILVTFSLSILLCYAVDYAFREKSTVAWLTAVAALGAACFVCNGLPALLPGFSVDYGFLGVLLPVFIFLGRNKWERVCLAGLGLVLLAAFSRAIQWYALLALPLLALYSEKRGKMKMKNLFYIYYPLHLAAIWALSLII